MAGILLIDDAQIMRNLMRTILEAKGYTICGEASNGKEGVEKYSKLRPDLVFCDIMMDEMDGVQCLRAIRVQDPNASVVICTSIGDELHNSEALTAGARAFIRKPVKAAEVIQVTESIIGKAVPDKKASYREIMEERAGRAGVAGKPLLDFLEAFRQYSGFRFDDPRVDENYLRENGAGVMIGVRALLSAKMSSQQADQVMSVFKDLLS